MQPTSTRMRHLQARYRKSYARLQRAIATRHQPARGLLDRLRRYERQLQRGGIAVAATAALFVAPEVLLAQATPVGGETQVNTYTTSDQSSSATAMDADGDYIIVWDDNQQDGSGYGIFGQRYNADGTTAGGEFRINATTTSSQLQPSVAMAADGDFVVAWTSGGGQDGSAYGIFARRYQADGTPLDVGDVQINVYTTSSQSNPSVAMDDSGNFVVTWQSLGQDGDITGVFARRYQSDGTVLDASDVQINVYTTNDQFAPSVAMDADGDYVITWTSVGQADYGDIFARRYQSDGTALDANDVQINVHTTSFQGASSVAMDADGDYVVAWQSYIQDGSGYGVFTRRYQADGTALDANDVSVNTYSTGFQGNPSVTTDADGDFAIAWQSFGQDGDSYGVFIRQYLADGTAVGSETRVNTYTTSLQRFPAIAMDIAGNFVVVWESDLQDGSSYGIFSQRYKVSSPFTERVPAGPETQVNTYTTLSQRSSATAMDADGDYVIVWHDTQQDGSGYGIFGQRYNADGTTAGGEFRINETTNASQVQPSVAMAADGDFVVAWTSGGGQDGDAFGIFARRYQADGTPLDANDVQVNVYTTSSQGNPSVAMAADGDYVIVWSSSGQDGNYYGIYARRYQADGMPLDATDIPVNAYTTSEQRFPSVAMADDGDFVVAWNSAGQDGSTYSIFARRYQADGTPLDATDVPINVFTTAIQRFPSAAMDADGNYVIAWTGSGSVSYSEVYARRFQADGTALDANDVLINAYTTSSQSFVSVAMDDDGDYVIVWESYQQDGDSNGVFARQFQADGTALGAEIQVNTYTTKSQKAPAVSMDADGDFVVAWESGYFSGTNQDGDRYGIFAQRYGDAALPVELADLRATALTHSNLLTWTTATESANEGFAVQRSYDGQHWEVIGWVAGAGESYTAQQYEHEDRMPREGVTYYRLEQLDYDGTATLSEVVSVIRTEDEVTQELRAYPNPVRGLLTVENTGAELRLYALTGQLILTKATNGDDRATLDMSGLAEGVYLLTTTLDSGEVRQVRLMVR